MARVGSDCTSIQISITRSHNAVLMLGHRHRQWSSNETTLSPRNVHSDDMLLSKDE